MSSKRNKRGRKPAAAADRKSRIIQTRVPKDLEKTLKKTAEKKRMTVSHLIRYVLEDTFNLVDGIVSDSSALVENVRRESKRIAASARGESPQSETENSQTNEADENEIGMDDVDAWQDVIVNKQSICLDCGEEIARGSRAYRGLSPKAGSKPVWLCANCIDDL